MRPEWALRTDRSFRVVHALFMWTTNDAVGRDNRFGPVYLYELQNRAGDGEIRPHILVFGEPATQGSRLGASLVDDSDYYFGRELIIRSIERKRRGGIAPETAAGHFL